ncbi:P1 family peptidase [Teichococcus aestuarii]
MPIPLAPQAILFDLLNGGDKDWGRFPPYRELGYTAARDAAPGAFALGSVGAGTGATTATVKGGLGSASGVTASGHRVAAIVAVNAVGSPLVGDGPHFWAAPFEQGRNSAVSACRRASCRRISPPAEGRRAQRHHHRPGRHRRGAEQGAGEAPRHHGR